MKKQIVKKVLFFSVVWMLLISGLYLSLWLQVAEERALDAQVLEEGVSPELGTAFSFSYPADEEAIQKLIQFFVRQKSYHQDPQVLKKEIKSWGLSQEDSHAELSGGGSFEGKGLTSLSFHLQFHSNQLAQKFKTEVFKRLKERAEGVEEINEHHIQASFNESEKIWLIHDGFNVIDLQYENFSYHGEP